ncbi:MAG TPA: hypothetical protein VFP27_11745, partial [Mycobacterium sp.]|nr:hypothetical protein [Mycobacterium sp.]
GGGPPHRDAAPGYAIGMRLVTLLPISVVAVLAAANPADPALRQRVLAAVLALAAWSAVYMAAVARGRTTLATVVDAAVLCGLGLERVS